MARPKVICGEMLPLSDGLVMVNTPLVKMAFSSSEKTWPPKHVSADPLFRSSVDLLRRVANDSISEVEISALAQLMHERFIYAKGWKQSRGLLRNSQPSPVKELKKLKKIALKGSHDAAFDAFKKLSLFTRDLIANVCGDFIYPISAVLSLDVLIVAIDKALADPKLKVRHREFELDRCASTLISIFQRLTGKEPRLANDPMTGKPVSALHRFVGDYGIIYSVWIVTEVSDGRLAKMLQDRTEFGRDDILLTG